MSQDSLEDHNSGDLVVKILTLLQISWMFIQLGVRLGREFPTSQLEIFTLSFAICSSITYIMLINAGPLGSGPKSSVWIPNDATHRDVLRKVPGYVMSMACLFALVLFGAAHCVAWNFEFPTALKKLFWRLSSVVTTAAMPFAYLLIQILDPISVTVFKVESQPRILE